jgi:uncharacterized RDD family membrane protein YckC
MTTAPAELPAARVHEVVTPEGVPLPLAVAGAGDRIGAIVIDVLIQLVALIGFSIALAYQGILVLDDDTLAALRYLVSFALWTCYFPAFELAWQGQTPGKRLLKIRAVDVRGGPLSAEAVIARNLSRQFEILLPIFAVATLSLGAWGNLAAVGWMVAFGFLPLFNKDRLRVGDMIAGTIVIHTPAAILLEDLTTSRAAAAHAFTDEQLDVYGIYELQVLEGVLRNAGQYGHAEAVQTVAQKIREKVRWEGEVQNDEVFLQAFYAALRGRLERRMLFGKRRKSKHDRT